MQLQDSVVVVTGASSGLGRAFARALVGEGAVVYGLARRQERLTDLHDELGDRFRPIVCDVRDEHAVRSAFDDITADAGRLDVLINNAGLGRFGPVDELAIDDWDVQMETNLRGVFLCTQAALPPMKRQNAEHGFGGYIINIASIAGLLGNPNLAAYNASKFGLRGFSEALMKEVRGDGIKVTCVYPGSIATEFGSSGDLKSASNAMTVDDLTATILHLLATRDNYLISEVVMRPLRPRG